LVRVVQQKHLVVLVIRVVQLLLDRWFLLMEVQAVMVIHQVAVVAVVRLAQVVLA
jgi:hypothetical protein